MNADPTSSEKMRAAQKGGDRTPSSPGSSVGSGVAPRRARLLVLEDEVSMGRALVRWLRDYDVVHCTMLAEALDRIRKGERFDLVVCDVMMPGGNAPDVHAALLKEAPSLAQRMLFMTGGATTPEAIAFVAANAPRIVSKPLDLRELRRRIGLLLAELDGDHASNG
jgi:DNA-binding response OmpR family regulator